MNNITISGKRCRAMQVSTLRRLVAPLVAGVLALGSSAFAAELPEGTVISKENVDKIWNDTFMGHKIGDLLSEKMAWYIRTYNKKIPLVKSPDVVPDPKYVEATAKYSGQVKFDPKTRDVTGYVAGLPFPNIDPADPYAGDKVIWNLYLGAPFGSDLHNTSHMLTSNKNGFESSQTWVFYRFMAKNRLWGGVAFPNEPDVFSKTVLVGRYPQDVKGVGTFQVQYDMHGRADDLWAYIKSARRIRRLSGNAWMDNVAGFDFLNDDTQNWNSRPSKYKSVKLIGKRWMLAATDFHPKIVKEKKNTPDEFPNMNFKEAPYFNTVEPMTPREVWVVEGIPPEGHPYGKKVAYMDVKIPAIYLTEMYDRKGEFWRMGTMAFNVQTGVKSGIKYYSAKAGEWIDFKAMHGTPWVAESDIDVGLSPTTFTPELLESLQ
ncbi:MAG: DUF1329 domain-containing protein [Georgfuchsia sp.]